MILNMLHNPIIFIKKNLESLLEDAQIHLLSFVDSPLSLPFSPKQTIINHQNQLTFLKFSLDIFMKRNMFVLNNSKLFHLAKTKKITTGNGSFRGQQRFGRSFLTVPCYISLKQLACKIVSHPPPPFILMSGL